ncbi:MAG: hypothetical protein Q4D19_08370 [Lautropia sp.]|nr:hypothetical protein [Lautropia sp.]
MDTDRRRSTPGSAAAVRAADADASRVDVSLTDALQSHAAEPYRPLRVRRALLQAGVALLLAPGASAAVVTHRPLPPISASQRRVACDFLAEACLLLEIYAAAAVEGKGADIARLQKDALQRSRWLLRRVKHELRMRFSPEDMKRLAMRWETVLTSVATPPSPEVARLMVPMARSVMRPLETLLPAYDVKRHGHAEGAVRRMLALAELRCQGVMACWLPDLVDWPRIALHRQSLDAWVQERVVSNSLSYIRLQTQWNLFSSALPLQGGRCVPNAADTLRRAGNDLTRLMG